MKIGDLVQPSFECALRGTYSSMTDSKAQKEYNAILNDLGIGIIINIGNINIPSMTGQPRSQPLILYTVHWLKKGINTELCREEDLIVIQSTEESNK